MPLGMRATRFGAVSKSTIVVVGTAFGQSTLTIPQHRQGDLVIIHGWTDGGTTPPTVAEGFKTLVSDGSGTNANCLGYLVAANEETQAGTWTGAKRLSCAVIRGASIDEAAVDQGGGAIDDLYWGSPRYAGERRALLFGDNAATYEGNAIATPPDGYKNLGYSGGSVIHMSYKLLTIVDAFAELTSSGGIPQFRTATVPLIQTI